jgi:hypothetical protein
MYVSRCKGGDIWLIESPVELRHPGKGHTYWPRGPNFYLGVWNSEAGRGSVSEGAPRRSAGVPQRDHTERRRALTVNSW